MSETFDQYSVPIYQKAFGLEIAGINGLSLNAIYKREADFALRAVNLGSPNSFSDGEGILDLASGAGEHAFAMSEILERRIPILITDPSVVLGTLAQEKLGARKAEGINEPISFMFGNTAKFHTITHDTVGNRLLRLISILGGSFAYTNIHETSQALRNMFDMLVPEGSLVLQWRQRPFHPYSAAYWRRFQESMLLARELGVFPAYTKSIDGVKAGCVEGRNGEMCFKICEDCEHPDPERAAEYQKIIWRKHDRDIHKWMHVVSGIEFVSHRRIYFDEHETRHDLPKTRLNDMCWEQKNSGIAQTKKLLHEAGFGDIRFISPVSESEWAGTHRLLAIVARKCGARIT